MDGADLHCALKSQQGAHSGSALHVPALLCSIPPPPLPCSVALRSYSRPSFFATSSLLGGAEVRDTWKEGWEINAKTTQLLGNQPRIEA